MKLLTTKQAAVRLGYYDDSYIRKLILSGKLEASKVGKQWLISEDQLNNFAVLNTISSKNKALFHLHQEIHFILEDIREVVQKRLEKKVTAKEAILEFSLARAFKTHSAILDLCRNGYGEDAVILMRALFEIEVTLLYVLKDETEETAYRFLDYDWILRRKTYRYVQTNERLRETMRERESEPHPNDMRVEHVLQEAERVDKKYGFSGHRHWSGKTIKEISRELGLWDLYHIVYDLPSQFTHNLPRIINDYMKMEDDFGVSLEFGPSSNWVKECLIGTFGMIHSITLKASEVFKLNLEKKLEEIAKEYVRSMDAKKV